MRLVMKVGSLVALCALLESGCADSPDSCREQGEPHRVVHAMWETLDRDYALFEQRLPDPAWAEIGRRACARIGSDLGDDGLFDVLLTMLQAFGDGHVSLEAPELGREADAWGGGYENAEALDGLRDVVATSYAKGELARGARDAFAWGRIGDFGYLDITRLDELSERGSEARDRAAANEAMTAALGDLGGVRGLVVDVRANSGGWDSVALDVAARFAGERRLAWTEQRRAGAAHDAFGEAEEHFVAASGPSAFSGPVVLLTSGGTFSAGETMALAMRVRNDVTLVGERTSGHFSDLEEARLPNGWILTYSAELYRAADGEIYETRGVPVDLEVSLDAEALAKGRDVMLEAALDLLGRERPR